MSRTIWWASWVVELFLASVVGATVIILTLLVDHYLQTRLFGAWFGLALGCVVAFRPLGAWFKPSWYADRYPEFVDQSPGRFRYRLASRAVVAIGIVSYAIILNVFRPPLPWVIVMILVLTAVVLATRAVIKEVPNTEA